MLDYKDVRFTFASRRSRRRRRLLRLGALVLLLAAAGAAWLNWVDGRRVRRAASQLLAGERIAASQELERAGWPLRRAAKAELRALLRLDDGDLEGGRRQLQGLPRPGGGGALPRPALLRLFADRARYRELLAYSEFLLPGGSDEALFHAALARTALYRPGESEQCLARLSASFQREQVKAVLLLRQVNQALRQGRFAYLFDRRGTPLAEYDPARGRSHPLLPGFDVSPFDPAMAGGLRYFSLTLDARVQLLLAELFRPFAGTFVLLDLEDNGIVAAYSRPRGGGPAQAAFEQEYEPGSIVKLVTQLAWRESAPVGFFPFTCRGSMTVAGKAFYDWIAHDTLPDSDAALAVSCNLAYARMGLQVGRERLVAALRLFSFDGEPWRDRWLRFRCGRIRLPRDDYQLCRLAVGLDQVTVTTLQAAVMAATIARDGEFSSPYLVDSEKNALQLGCYAHRGGRRRILADDRALRELKSGMAAVVASEQGTGRRARLDAVCVAAKTGTAGSSADGLDAILIGYFPCARPRYAFAFRLEGGGRAELNGATLLHDFLLRLPLP